MTRSNSITWAWAFIAVSIATLVSFLLAGRDAHANAPTLHETIAAAVPSLGSKREPTVDAEELADAVTAATPNRQWAALLLTIASHESALSARIARGECRKHECDHGRAWGLWQAWKAPHNEAVWGSPDITVQAREASHIAHQYFNMCKTSGVPFPLSTMRAYAGHGCSTPIKGEDARMRTFERLMRRL